MPKGSDPGTEEDEEGEMSVITPLKKHHLTGVSLCIFMVSTALLSATHAHQLGLASGPRTEMLVTGVMHLSLWMQQALFKSLQ